MCPQSGDSIVIISEEEQTALATLNNMGARGWRGEGDATATHCEFMEQHWEVLPPEILALNQLRSLSLMKCEQLKSLPPEMAAELPELRQLNLMYCSAIESFPDLSGTKLKPKDVKTLGAPVAEKWKMGGLK